MREEQPRASAPPPLRPFLLTSGRVVADSDLAIETQVVSTAAGLTRAQALPFEYGDIVALCTQPLSVAEVAARLSLHIGVVRVLVSDLNADGDLVVYRAPVEASRDIDILQRVIRGLREIS
ncbi:MAG: DUF742 domain-containing protein [Actinokineospora sp.]